jgi:hypothetical protein
LKGILRKGGRTLFINLINASLLLPATAFIFLQIKGYFIKSEGIKAVKKKHIIPIFRVQKTKKKESKILGITNQLHQHQQTE